MWLRIICMLQECREDMCDPLKASFLETALVDALALRILRGDAIAFLATLNKRLDNLRRRGLL